MQNRTMNDAVLSQTIADLPHDKVTAAGIEKRITGVTYMVLPDSTVTICNVLLENGFSVRGEAACVDPRNFNMEIGRNLAYKDAFGKLWDFEGYLLAERRFANKRLLS